MRKYFNRSMFFLSAAFIIYLSYEIYERMLTLSSGINTWELLDLIKHLLLVVIICLFIKFMLVANSGHLFSPKASQLWNYTFIGFLILGVISFIEVRWNNGSSLYFAVCVFLAFFCYALSNIFKEATALKSENDLTI